MNPAAVTVNFKRIENLALLFGLLSKSELELLRDGLAELHINAPIGMWTTEKRDLLSAVLTALYRKNQSNQ